MFNQNKGTTEIQRIFLAPCAGSPASAPEIVRVYIPDFEIPAEGLTIRVGEKFRLLPINDPTVGKIQRVSPSATPNEAYPRPVEVVAEGTD